MTLTGQDRRKDRQTEGQTEKSAYWVRLTLWLKNLGLKSFSINRIKIQINWLPIHLRHFPGKDILLFLVRCNATQVYRNPLWRKTSTSLGRAWSWIIMLSSYSRSSSFLTSSSFLRSSSYLRSSLFCDRLHFEVVFLIYSMSRSNFFFPASKSDLKHRE